MTLNTPEIGVDIPAGTDDEIFQECAERVRIAEAVESKNRADALDDLEFDDGNQWPINIYKDQPNRVKLTINHTANIVRRIENNMKQQRPRMTVHPVSDATVNKAKKIAGLLRHIEVNSNASVAYDAAGGAAVRMGWGYFRAVSEYTAPDAFEQELIIQPIENAFSCYIDPNAVLPDGSDMEWFVITRLMARSEYHRLYPDQPKRDWTQGGAGDTNLLWETKEQIRLAEYYRIKHVSDELLKLSDGRTIFRSEFSKQAFGLAGITIVKTRPSARKQVEWFRLSGKSVVDRRALKGTMIPCFRVQGCAININGEVRRKGVVRNLKDPARQYNYWQSAKTEKLALVSKSPWIAAEEQLDGRPEWDDANQRSYSVLKYKIIKDAAGQPINVPPPQRAMPVEVDSAFVEAGQNAQKDLLAVAGMPHEPGQDKEGVVVSGVALRRRQAMSDISHFQYYDNQTLAIAALGRYLLEQIPYYYAEPGRLQRIIGEDGQPEMVTFNDLTDPESNLLIGRYDIVMDTGPGYDTKREEGAQMMMELLSVKPLADQVVKVGADLVVRGIDAPYMDELANRLSTTNPEGMQKAVKALPKDAQAIVVSLQQQLQVAQQKIQQQELEIKYKSQIEQGWMQTELQKTLMQSHVKAHDTDTRAQSSVDVAEINAAGKIIDSRQEHGHQERSDAARMEHEAALAEKANAAKPKNGSAE